MSLIFSQEFSLAKLSVSEKADEMFVKELAACKEDTFNRWLLTFSPVSKKSMLIKTFSKFSPACLEQILEELTKKNQLEKIQEENADSNLRIILLVLRLLPVNAKL